MTDIKIEAARRMVVDQVLDSARANETESTKIREAQERAEVLEHAAQLKRQVATVLAGSASHPTPDQVQHIDDGLGMTVGILRLALPEDPTVEALERYRDLTERLFEVALTQMNRVKDRLKERQATQATGQIPDEFLPQPDPLTAAPSEDSGPHPVLPAAPAWPGLLGQRLALDVGDAEPMVGRLTAVDPERLTVAVDAGTRAGESVRVDIAGIRDWQALPEPPAAAPMEPAGYPEQPAVAAPPLPRRERKADYVPRPLEPAEADACGQVLEVLRAEGQQPAAEPLIDPDCRDGKCGSCVGGPCEHECHDVQPEEPDGGEAAVGRFQPADGPAGADRAGAVDDGQRPGAGGPTPGPARSDVTGDTQNGDAS